MRCRGHGGVGVLEKRRNGGVDGSSKIHMYTTLIRIRGGDNMKRNSIGGPGEAKAGVKVGRHESCSVETNAGYF